MSRKQLHMCVYTHRDTVLNLVLNLTPWPGDPLLGCYRYSCRSISRSKEGTRVSINTVRHDITRRNPIGRVFIIYIPRGVGAFGLRLLTTSSHRELFRIVNYWLSATRIRIPHPLYGIKTRPTLFPA